LARTFYRIVKTNPAVVDDFRSYGELGVHIAPDTDGMRRLARGVSVYETFDQACRAARRSPRLGRFVATLVIPDNDDRLMWERTGGRPGHYTMWARTEEQAPTIASYVQSVDPLQ